MSRYVPLFILLFALSPLAHGMGEGGTSLPPPDQDMDQSPGDDEGEEKGIIPTNSVVNESTHPVTPVTVFPEKPRYNLALEELARAEALWSKGEAEAASDTALEAYDDLMDVHISRRNKKGRKKLHSERRRAAAVYVKAGIWFIQDFVEKQGRTAAAIEEGQGRLGDLRDVACNYEDLNRALNKAIASLATPPSN